MNPKDKNLELVLNDMGGAVMYVSEGKVGTLRAHTKHHEPIVLVAVDGSSAIVKREGYEPRNSSSEQDNRCSEP